MSDLQFYLNTLFDQNLASVINEVGYCGENPLHLATHIGNVAIIEAITDFKDCNMLVKDVYGDNAIHIAVKLGHMDVVKLLLARSPTDSVYAVNGKGLTALDIAKSPVSDHDIRILTRFTPCASIIVDDLRLKIMEGRKRCYNYILQFMDKEKTRLREQMIDAAVRQLDKRHKDIRIMCPSNMATFPRIYSDICDSAKVPWERIDDEIRHDIVTKAASSMAVPRSITVEEKSLNI
jgi:ankyrin repeat protein